MISSIRLAVINNTNVCICVRVYWFQLRQIEIIIEISFEYQLIN